MQPKTYAAGEHIFRSGEKSLAVYVITEGEVSISLDDGGEVVRLYAGDLFGESGVLEKRPRSANATALVPTALLVTEAETFFTAFGMNNGRALALVKLLCRRLRDTSARVAHSEAGATRAPLDHAAIRLLPDHERLRGELDMRAVDVTHLPFQVGNQIGAEVPPTASNASCCIPAHGDTELAAPHFEIVRRDGQVGIHDLGSRWGTIVNGMTLSRQSGRSFVPLHHGNNQIVAGRTASPWRFRVQLLGE